MPPESSLRRVSLRVATKVLFYSAPARAPPPLLEERPHGLRAASGLGGLRVPGAFETLVGVDELVAAGAEARGERPGFVSRMLNKIF